MNDKVYQSLKRFVENVNSGSIGKAFVCKVLSINTDQRSATVEPINGDADISDARFICDVTGKTKFLPKVNSIVVVQMFSQTGGVIIAFSELEEIHLNGEDKGGMVTAGSLLQKINELEQQINTLKTIFATWVPVPNDGGLALKTLTTSFSSQTITLTVQTDIENSKVKHGTGS